MHEVHDLTKPPVYKKSKAGDFFETSGEFNFFKSTDAVPAPKLHEDGELTAGVNVVIPLIADSLEWALSSPPPLHQFDEPPLIVEVDHLELHPGKEAEEILLEQGQTVTDVVGKELWTYNDAAKYEGLIPQNPDWTEFIDEKTGAWVYLDEFGNRVEKPLDVSFKHPPAAAHSHHDHH